MLTAWHLKEADAFYQLYQHHLQAKKVIEYRMYTTNKRKAEEHDTHDQEQYLTEYEPLIMEEWALHLLQHIPDFTNITTTPIPREGLIDASCEVCCDPCMHEEAGDGESTTDMYECDVCNRTYHWNCLVQLKCYSEEQKEEVIADANWSCPACADLNEQQKQNRRNDSEKELMKVTWNPTWEAKEQMDTWESFKEQVEQFEAEQATPPPPLDKELDNIERQGFPLNHTSNTWLTLT